MNFVEEIQSYAGLIFNLRMDAFYPVNSARSSRVTRLMRPNQRKRHFAAGPGRGKLRKWWHLGMRPSSLSPHRFIIHHKENMKQELC